MLSWFWKASDNRRRPRLKLDRRDPVVLVLELLLVRCLGPGAAGEVGGVGACLGLCTLDVSNLPSACLWIVRAGDCVRED